MACCECEFSRMASTRVHASGFFCSSLRTLSAATRCIFKSQGQCLAACGHQSQHCRAAQHCKLARQESPTRCLLQLQTVQWQQIQSNSSNSVSKMFCIQQLGALHSDRGCEIAGPQGLCLRLLMTGDEAIQMQIRDFECQIFDVQARSPTFQPQETNTTCFQRQSPLCCR